MFQSSSAICPQRIIRFSRFLKQAQLQELTYLNQFYQNQLKPLFKHKEIICHAYSQSLLQLVDAIKFQMSNSTVIEYFPEFSGFLEQIKKVIYFSSSEKQTGRSDLFHELQSDEQNLPLTRKDQIKSQMKVKNIEIKDKNADASKKAIPESLNKAPNLSCLGCTQFFYQNQDFVTKQVNATDVMILPSAKKLKMYEQEFKNYVCSLLNGRGGVILFSCIEENQKYIVKGQLISQNTKESLLQQIIQVFQTFYPKLTFSANAHLSFVPVAKGLKKQNELIYREGTFVTRVKVWNNTPQQLYFYTKNNKLYIPRDPKQIGGSSEFKTIDMKFMDILKLLKRKFKQNYIPVGWNKQTDIIINDKPHCFSDHQCSQPYGGIKTTSQKTKQIQQVADAYSFENSYSYVSGINLNKVPQSKVINFLVAQRLTSFKFFSSFKPGLVASSQIQLLFHNTSPYKLQQIISKIQHGNHHLRPNFLILDHTIRLQKVLSESQFLEVYAFVREQNQRQQINYFTNKDGSQDSYIQCGSKISIFFLHMKFKTEGKIQTKLMRLDPTRKDKIKLLYSKP